MTPQPFVMGADRVCIADAEAPEAGYRLKVYRRRDGRHEAVLYGPRGIPIYLAVLYPTAAEVIEGATDFLALTLKLPHVASVIRVNARAELVQ